MAAPVSLQASLLQVPLQRRLRSPCRAASISPAHRSDEILEQLPDAAPERRVETGEGLDGLTLAIWWRDEHQLVVEVHRQLTGVVDLTGSVNLGLLADAVGCEALLVQRRSRNRSVGRGLPMNAPRRWAS